MIALAVVYLFLKRKLKFHKRWGIRNELSCLRRTDLQAVTLRRHWATVGKVTSILNICGISRPYGGECDAV